MATQIEPPNGFLCPVSFELMKRPVRLVATGKVYDETSIADWFGLGKRSCPSTGQTLTTLEYEYDTELQTQIERWRDETGYREAAETRRPVASVSPITVRKLMNAARKGELGKIQQLQREGCVLSVVDKQYHEFTAVHYAAQFGHVEVMGFLLSYGLDPDQKDTMGLTPLHIAAYYGNQKGVNVLLSRGANPNLQDKGGSTPLHLATRRGYKSIILALLENDADRYIKDYSGDTPRDKAGLWGRFLIRRMLK